MELLGIDIGTSHIKAVSIEKNNKNKLKSYAVSPIKELSEKVSSDAEKDWTEAAAYLKYFLKENQFIANQAVCIVPDSKVFTKVISMPFLEGKDLDTAVKWEAEQHLPQALSEVRLKYTVLTSSKQNLSKKDKMKMIAKGNLYEEDKSQANPTMEILLIAVPKITVDKYLTILNKSGLEPVGLEPCSLSSIRSTVLNDIGIPTLIMNFGYSTVSFYLTVNNSLRFVRTINFSVASLIKAIKQELDVSESNANEYLFTYGLKENELGGKIRQMIMPVIKIIVDELIKSKQFVETRPNLMTDLDMGKIKRVLLMGGGTLIPDLMVYLIEQVNCEIEFASTWDSVDIGSIKNKEELIKLAPLFAPSVGAALKEIQ